MAPTDITVPPEWNEDEPATLTWLTSDGATVVIGQALCELEAAKATAEIVSSATGTLRHMTGEGMVRAGALLGRVIPPGEPVPPATIPARSPDRSRRAPRTARKQAEIDVLRAGRRDSLPSTVLTQVGIGDLSESLREEGASVTALVVYEAARALRAYPAFNSSFGPEGTVGHERIRMGVAIDVDPHGLKVAIVDDPDEKTLDQIAGELQILLYRYLTKAFSPRDLRGATFTLTDLTSFGATWSIPLLVDQQAAILGLGSISDPLEQSLTLSLTFDHRVASGREASLFLRDIARRIATRARGAPVTCSRCGRRTSDMPSGRAYLLSAGTADGPAAICPDCLDLSAR